MTMSDDRRESSFFGPTNANLDQKLDYIIGFLADLLAHQQELTKQIGHVLNLQHLAARNLRKEAKHMKVDLTDLEAQVRHLSDVGESVKTLVNGLANKVDEASNQPTVDPEQLKSLADQIRRVSDAMAEAVVAKTPMEQ